MLQRMHYFANQYDTGWNRNQSLSTIFIHHYQTIKLNCWLLVHYSNANMQMHLYVTNSIVILQQRFSFVFMSNFYHQKNCHTCVWIDAVAILPLILYKKIVSKRRQFWTHCQIYTVFTLISILHVNIEKGAFCKQTNSTGGQRSFWQCKIR